ncbi:MAG TPA: ABC transporter permease [Candidatus Binatia bacterium]|nr:ABC transporter permease [Candidatus Binatia bacterium]
MIARALLASVRKDWRLLARDRIGLFFMAVAPIVVIAVAGLSLASLYGASPRGDTAYVLPVVDEDGGELGATLRRRLADEPAVELRFVDRQAALAAISRREAGAALVLPPGTSAALRHGEPARLLLLTDPVKYLEIANVRNLVQELRHAVGGEALDRARARLERARAHALRARQRMERLLARVRAELERAAAEGREGRRRLAAEIDAASARAADVERRLRDRMAAAASERSEAARERVAAELEPLAQFLRDVARYRSEFDAWLMAARAAAGSFADRLPAPPSPPAVPPAVAAFESGGAEKLADRLVGAPAALGGDAVDWLPPGELRGILSLPKVPPAVATAVPSAEKLASRLPAPPPAVRLPRLLEIDEQSVTGAPARLNTFDQNVPGFSVTFLLLGMLLGVSLGLIDERELGTLDRARATPSPVGALVVGKLLVRFAVGVVQMAVLLAVGHVAFGASLGPEPWALLLPTAGIVFAGTAFGVLVAGLARSREAVLPLGSIAIVTMAAVGGCWWPIDLEPRWMRQVALGFPTTWAMAAFNDLMIRRQGAAAALRPTLVLLAFGTTFLVLGVPLFVRRSRPDV